MKFVRLAEVNQIYGTSLFELGLFTLDQKSVSVSKKYGLMVSLDLHLGLPLLQSTCMTNAS